MKIDITVNVYHHYVMPGELDGLTDRSWERIRQHIKKRDGSICHYCHKDSQEGHVDHIIPLAEGGTDAFDNLVWSCPSCNQSKGKNARPSTKKRQSQFANHREFILCRDVKENEQCCLLLGEKQGEQEVVMDNDGNERPLSYGVVGYIEHIDGVVKTYSVPWTPSPLEADYQEILKCDSFPGMSTCIIINRDRMKYYHLQDVTERQQTWVEEKHKDSLDALPVILPPASRGGVLYLDGGGDE